MAWSLHRRVLGPLRRLVDASALLAAGLDEGPVDIDGPREVQLVATALEDLRRQRIRVHRRSLRRPAAAGRIGPLGPAPLVRAAAEAGWVGRFTFRLGEGQGELRVAGADLVDCTCGELTGRRAFRHLYTWRGGSYRFRADPTVGRAGPRLTTWQQALLDAARDAIDVDRLALVFPHPDLVVHPGDRRGEAACLRLTPDEVRLLDRLTAPTPLAALMPEDELEAFEARLVLYRLDLLGLVEIVDTGGWAGSDRR